LRSKEDESVGFIASLKPNVAYLVLNFCALWKKQTTLPSLAYAGIPYQVFGERTGALALMISADPRYCRELLLIPL
jgi:hypothetical protein